ncbi:MAG: FtsX-like permease family protein [Verrucomicrobiaceae bacterium]|nr:MAG: FtsX-like permease family protein [Verrucomicrobiaceae bacterium]
MLGIALKMLFRDRAKYAMLVCGLSFCSLLMCQQISVFCGLMMWTTATVRNIGAPVWVVDAKVEQANEVIPMRQIEVERVRSVPGVAWAVPLFIGMEQARLADGSFQNVQLTGLDTGTLTGRPMEMRAGRIEDLRLPNAVIVDQVAVEKFRKKGIKIQLGTTFEINDKEARVVGICHAARSFFGQPYIYTTFDRAMEYTKPTRKQLSFVLAGPSAGVTDEELAARISRLPGLRAITKDNLFWLTVLWYIKNTGIPISIGTVVILGIIVGIAIAGQTFYLFVHDNLRFLAAFKAMGARMPTLAAMVLLQAFSVGFIGYGIGVGLVSWFGSVVLVKEQPPFFMPWQVPTFVAIVIVFICSFSALIGLIKVARLEPAVVFR